MSDTNQPVIVSSKQWPTFLGIAMIIVIGALLFFLISSNQKTDSAPAIQDTTNKSNSNGFLGEKGKAVEAVEDTIYIDEAEVDNGNLHAFNYFSKAANKTIYFFIIKASDGTYRAAANACEVCFESKKGFRQVGDLIRCENCQVAYPKDKIALEKGGCNPGPIDADVPVQDGKLIIQAADLEKVAYLF